MIFLPFLDLVSVYADPFELVQAVFYDILYFRGMEQRAVLRRDDGHIQSLDLL
jgi:hypothetical protein